MKTSYTPGPWRVEERPFMHQWRVSGRFLPVAQCPSENDARLIAAAPELLEALEIALQQLGGELPKVDAIMHAAIKKAKGE